MHPSLSPPNADDIPDLHSLLGDARVWTHYPHGRHTEIAQTRAVVDRWIREWEAAGHGMWVLRDTRSRQLIGTCGTMPRAHAWILGYRLDPAFQGRHLASQVARKALKAAFDADPHKPLVAFMAGHNSASAHVAEAAGLTLRHEVPDPSGAFPGTTRLIYADRALDALALGSVMPR